MIAVKERTEKRIADVMRAMGYNVLAVLERSGRFPLLIPGRKVIVHGRNIVGNEGDKYYAQKSCGESPTNAFTTLELGKNDVTSNGWAATHPNKTSDRSHMNSKIASTQKAVTSGYPKTADADADNTGAGEDVISWAFSYTKTDFNATGIVAGLITVASPGASAALLTGFYFGAPTAFDKTADDTLKIFVNHAPNGV